MFYFSKSIVVFGLDEVIKFVHFLKAFSRGRLFNFAESSSDSSYFNDKRRDGYFCIEKRKYKIDSDKNEERNL